MKGTKAFAALLALLLAGTPAFAATTAPQGDVFSRVTARSFTGKALPLATLRTLPRSQPPRRWTSARSSSSG